MNQREKHYVSLRHGYRTQRCSLSEAERTLEVSNIELVHGVTGR
jgi:hypothetical protein